MVDRNLNYGRHHIERFLKDAAPYHRVLDLGAGRGADLLQAREIQLSAALFALESYHPYARELRKANIEVFSFDLERAVFPFDDESLDIIMANQILEHVKEVFWIFNEVSRTLKIGGRLLLGVPNLASAHNRLLLAIGRQPTIIKTASAHVRGYTKHDLLRFVQECWPGGYELRGFGGGNFYPFPGVVAKPLAMMLPNMAWAIFLSLEKTKAYDGAFVRFPGEKQLETNFYVGSLSGEHVTASSQSE